MHCLIHLNRLPKNKIQPWHRNRIHGSDAKINKPDTKTKICKQIFVLESATVDFVEPGPLDHFVALARSDNYELRITNYFSPFFFAVDAKKCIFAIGMRRGANCSPSFF